MAEKSCRECTFGKPCGHPYYRFVCSNEKHIKRMVDAIEYEYNEYDGPSYSCGDFEPRPEVEKR